MRHLRECKSVLPRQKKKMLTNTVYRDRSGQAVVIGSGLHREMVEGDTLYRVYTLGLDAFTSSWVIHNRDPQLGQPLDITETFIIVDRDGHRHEIEDSLRTTLFPLESH